MAAVGAALCTLQTPASAGSECQGGGTWNWVFAGYPDYGVSMQVIMTRSDASWVGYAPGPAPGGQFGCISGDGTLVSGNNFPVQFSDRYESPKHQNFSIYHMDSWNVSVDWNGVITIVNNTWGGTSVVQGVCSGNPSAPPTGTNGQVFATAGDTDILVNFGVPQGNFGACQPQRPPP
jgi:hypothetical protein